jgi:hypothetical protein
MRYKKEILKALQQGQTIALRRMQASSIFLGQSKKFHIQQVKFPEPEKTKKLSLQHQKKMTSKKSYKQYTEY